MAEGVKKSAKRPAVHFAAGLATGISSAALLQPADLLKTRLQQAHHASFRQTFQAIRQSEHGLRSLWRGTLPSVLRTGFGSALYFSSLDIVRRSVARASPFSTRSTGASSSTLPQLSSAGNLISGALARVAAGLVIMPLTVLKVRYESDLYHYRSFTGAAAGVLRTEGVRGFFTGFGATALRDAPYAGLYVVCYESAKKRLSTQVNAVKSAAAGLDGSGAAFVVDDGRPLLDARMAAGINSASSVFAAATATAITNPFDAIKTRLQLQPQKYGNMLRTATTMLRDDGLRSMFDGLALRMTRKALSSAIVWTLYEQLVRVGEARI